MRPPTRTPQQRDRRFARVRRLTQVVFVGAGVSSAVLMGYAAANAKPVTTTPVTTATTPTTTPAATKSSSGTSATVPTTAPITTTTVCTSTPSGVVTCY
jgi:hypothetical protein